MKNVQIRLEYFACKLKCKKLHSDIRRACIHFLLTDTPCKITNINSKNF